MTPKMLVSLLSLASLAVGFGLGIVVDRTVLADERVDLKGPPQGDRSPPRDHRGRKDRWADRRHVKRMDRLAEELGLDDEQREKISAIFAARGPRFQAVLQEVKPRLQKLEEETHAAIKAVLRPEQLEKLEAMRSQRKMRGDRRGPGGGGPRWGRRSPWDGQRRGPPGQGPPGEGPPGELVPPPEELGPPPGEMPPPPGEPAEQTGDER